MAVNAFLLIILIALLAEFAFNLIANWLNARAVRLEPPRPLADLYQPEDYRRSQEYTRATLLFSSVARGYRLTILLAFWFAGGFNWLDRIVRSWDFHPIVAGLLYIGILMLAYGVVTLPLGIYSTFGLEERFGFNRTTVRTFMMDRLKGLALTLAVGAPLLAVILAFFQYAGPWAWLYGWITVSLFTLAAQFVAPIWIMPLFNKFTPMEPGPLRDAILSYTAHIDFPLENLFVMDGSKRSTKSNAFFAGFGRHKRIALFDTLIAQITVPEMVGVLAHEIGHYKLKHVPLGIAIDIAHTGLMFFLLSVFLGSAGLYQAFGMDQPSIYAGLLFFALLYTPVELVLGILLQMLSRHNEYAADRFAAQTAPEPEGLVGALKKLSTNNLSNLTPHPFYVFLNYSHPPLLQRMGAIHRAEAERRQSAA